MAEMTLTKKIEMLEKAYPCTGRHCERHAPVAKHRGEDKGR